MYPYTNEDAAWQRLQDIQREMENSRLMAASQPRVALETLGRLAGRVWLLAGLASRRPPRKRPHSIRHDAA
ncbi:MAG: hypothetical protein AUG06_06705 [Actinobacteria bacterium 13_1_20CM_2_65_11]|nr:MAG: hypothetical protein AUH40_03370 [Chloroflexi bacterium 13_1_40CM_65_17]OLC68440.1 MAG: hypothetical protein AUH69_01370 [Actinobacteria bacterium 13_1_40CM_4_65_12]OLD26361.1 MAG: hypothetical protein AUJ02_02675 [Chloroflexi bacterium 13_1_40CM_3_65_12]OLD49874.1 MAG: hypothetical protein AUI42_05950 [Actinobacteria bacterium 13_1_40CM_2_65_8]OLE79884.1 MAG: hypothetical protein AUG06_06705 [Actinobacteria bacterium 13_1_20CM_2_65_11]